MEAKVKRSKKQSKSRFLNMPPELQSMVVDKLDAVSYCSLKLVCKGINMWTKDPPKLSASEWQQFHLVFETPAHKRRKLHTLGCPGCKKVLDKGLFSDQAASKALDKGRLCISCAIQAGSHDKRMIKIKRQAFFGCRGCQKAKPFDEQDNCLVEKAHWYEHFPETNEGLFRASRGCRWCHSCWAIIQNFRSLDRSP